jgi:hypothetical protein
MKLHWLKLNFPCILEIPQLKDYAGQPLLFKEPAFRTRCVTDEVFEHHLVKAYRDQLVIVEVDANGAAFVPPAAPSVAAPEPELPVDPTPIPPISEPEAPAAPATEEVAKANEPSSASVSTEETSSKDGETDKGFEIKRRRNNR